ncbi:MAG: 1,4-alpha-glucan branching enzyme, partial [Clostridia bacterium]|nr:1,4-alpha-glucan branching enzyme [Clostridia bacterium]
MFTDYDSYLFHEGTDYELYKKLGAHICEKDGVRGVSFAVWAPNAKAVTLRISIDGNGWRGVEMNEERSYTVAMERGAGGVWETFVKWAGKWTVYRYEVLGADGILRKKSDPAASFSQKRPSALSIVWDGSEYVWGDGAYMETVDAGQAASRPMSIYEVHLGSWKKDYRENPDGFVGYRRLADELADYVNYMGFTHVELIGICEHPFDGSWGYQVTGFYSPTSRYGNPDDFRYFVDKMHRCGIGVILDWVPAHFPKDPFGLENFDGTALFESPDPLLAEYPEWGTKAFDHS